jgi:hypothetical protein
MLTKKDKQYIEDELAKINKYLKQEVGPGMSNFSEITPHIYITNWVGACNHTYLKDKIIELVICVSKEKKTKEALKIYDRLHIQHVAIPIVDDPRESLNIHLDKFYDMMHSSVMEEKNILVHCETGSSASVALVLYYLLRRYYATNFGKKDKMDRDLISKQFKLKQLMEYVKDRRPCIEPNLGFVAQLLTVELILKKKYSVLYEARIEEQRKEQEREDDESAEEQRQVISKTRNTKQQKKVRFKITKESESDSESFSDARNRSRNRSILNMNKKPLEEFSEESESESKPEDNEISDDSFAQEENAILARRKAAMDRRAKMFGGKKSNKWAQSQPADNSTESDQSAEL